MTDPRLEETLRDPSFYPHRPLRVDVIQTHISYIFLAGTLVYKIKKAVDFGFLDFTTLEKRRYFAEEELRLNRRLAPSIYREVVPISASGDGRLVLGDRGEIVEYALVMERIPEDRMLQRLLEEGKVTPPVMRDIARRVYEFHCTADTGGEIDRIGSIETIRFNHRENFDQTKPFIGLTITEDRYNFISAYATDFMNRKESLFLKRVEDHRIRDCHGDLHLQHICLGDTVIIFDCIEFNRRFRFLDVAAEIAFLAMDLDFNGYSFFGDVFIDAYVAESDDSEINELINFYKCYFAYVRGKVIGFRVAEKGIAQDEREDARRLASRYFEQAYGYAARLEKPAVVIMTGLMGTGKSALAVAAASPLGASIVRTDVVRKELLGIDPAERRCESFGSGIYSADMNRRTYDAALKAAALLLREGRSVIIDASFKKREERRSAREIAVETGADFFIVECRSPEEILRKRLDERQAKGADASDGRWEILKDQREAFEIILDGETAPGKHVTIDTSQPPEGCLSTMIGAVRLRGKAGERTPQA
ncbi:MAG: AAA family ATPase [Deltaproteobacteria bacterium]|nr:AAA family ATPase [Deltaproteobacteria bacterium]